MCVIVPFICVFIFCVCVCVCVLASESDGEEGRESPTVERKEKVENGTHNPSDSVNFCVFIYLLIATEFYRARRKKSQNL